MEYDKMDILTELDGLLYNLDLLDEELFWHDTFYERLKAIFFKSELGDSCY